MATANDVAMYFVCQADTDAGDVVTNLKVQKLLYYAQGASLALRGIPLFEEDFERWQHGPVVREIYHSLKEFRSSHIAIPTACADAANLTGEERSLLSEIYNKFGQFSAWRLRDMTHAEEAWKATSPNAVISKDLIRDSFQKHHLS